MLQLKYIFKFFLSLIANPDQFWRYLTDPEQREANVDYMHRNYYLPMMAGVSVVLFFLNGNKSEEFSLEVAMKSAVSFLVAYYAGMFLANMLTRRVLEKFIPGTYEKNRFQIFVGYNMSFLMGVELLSSFFSIRFIDSVVIYIVYIVWSGITTFLGVNDRYRWSATFFVSFFLFISPVLIKFLLRQMNQL